VKLVGLLSSSPLKPADFLPPSRAAKPCCYTFLPRMADVSIVVRGPILEMVSLSIDIDDEPYCGWTEITTGRDFG
jgi:hypothetical protein